VTWQGKILSSGKGKSKKEAEARAAADALRSKSWEG
jgi:dsRNA-specific ribonuclease